MIYDNPLPGEPRIYTCPRCNKTFREGNMACAVMHYGSGCCHYGDTEINPVPASPQPQDTPKENDHE